MKPAKRRLTAFLVLVGIIVIGFCLYAGFRSGWASYLYSKAREDLADGNVSTGIDKLRKARRWDPLHPRATLLLARAAEGTHDTDHARTLLREFHDAGGRTVETMDALARLLGPMSPDLYEEMVELFPDAIAGPLGLARGGWTDLPLREALRSLPPTNPGETTRGFALLHLDDDFGVDGYGTPAAVQSLLEARKTGANSVSIRVPGFLDDIFDTEIGRGTGLGGESERAVSRMIRDARLLGFRVLLKPHIMIGRITETEWRGTIHFEDPKDSAQWWSSYEEFILRYALLADEWQVEAFCVGVELREMVRHHPDRWSDLIAKVREVYSGKLTYAANWFYEYEEVPFWAELDFIGIQFFFPLTEKDDPTIDDLIEGMQPELANMQDLAIGYDRPIVLTEVGYKSTPGSTREPWIWPELEDPPDPEIQRRAYEAIFSVFEDVPWFGGMYWWNWLTTPEPDEKFLRDFTPQGKPALEVIRRNWLKPGE